MSDSRILRSATSVLHLSGMDTRLPGFGLIANFDYVNSICSFNVINMTGKKAGWDCMPVLRAGVTGTGRTIFIRQTSNRQNTLNFM